MMAKSALFAAVALLSGAVHAGTTNIFLLVGQSNMAGRGVLTGSAPVSAERIVVFDAEGKASPAKEPLHHDKKTAGAGLAMSFARAYADEHPGVTVALMPCAVGGSSIGSWKPGSGKNYLAMAKAVEAVRGKGEFAGILWHQGESDSGSKAAASAYAGKLKALVAALRKDVADVPVVLGELGRYLDSYVTKPKDGSAPKIRLPFWKDVNIATHEVAGGLDRCRCASSEGLEHKGDKLHFDTPSLRKLGLRYYEAWKECAAGK